MKGGKYMYPDRRGTTTVPLGFEVVEARIGRRGTESLRVISGPFSSRDAARTYAELAKKQSSKPGVEIRVRERWGLDDLPVIF